MKRNNAFLATALAAVLSATLALPCAEAGEVAVNYDKARKDRWRCRLCPFEAATSHAGSWTAGAISVAEAQPRFGRDNGLDDEGHYLDLNAEYRHRDGNGRSVALTGTDLALDSRDATLRIEGNRHGLTFRWREVPRNVATDGRTPYTGRTSLSLPARWVTAFDTSDMTALVDSGRQFDYATHRRKATVRAHLGLRPRWRIEGDYSRETRTGTQETHADFLYQAAGLPKPIDHETEEAGARVRFEGAAFLFAAGLRESRFRNDHRSLEWENAYAAAPATGRKALAPRNDARSLSLVSRWTPARRTTVHGTLTWGRLGQDEPFLPYTSNAALVVEPPPAGSLPGPVRTFAGTLQLNTTLTNRLRVGFKHRRRERENDTRALALTPVLGDLFATLPRENRIYAFTRANTELRLQYRLARRVKLSAGSSANRVRRAPLEITRNDERTSWMTLLATDLRGFRTSLKFSDADRDASPFRDITANNPRMRRFYQAERRQRTWTAELDYRFASTGLSVGFDADYRRNDYPGSALGLHRDEDRGWGADFTYTPNASITLSGFHTVRQAGARTAGSSAFALADWWYGTEDAVDTTGLALDLRGLATERLDLSITYTHSRGLGRYDTEREGVPDAFPTLLSEHLALDIRARYRWKERVTLTARYYHEDYGSTDWALDGVGQAAARNLISFGRTSPDYSNGLVSFSVETRL